MFYDVIIIGAGPAGMSAAIYTARQKLKTLILSKDVGGQAANSNKVENFLGFNLISGSELSEKFYNHLKNFPEIELKIGVEIQKIEKDDGKFCIKTKDNKEFKTKSVIITSGKKPRELKVPGEREFKGKGVTYCATCDAPFFKNKVVAVIGAGDAALEAAYQLIKIAKKVYILNKYPEFKDEVDKILLENVKKAKNAEIIYKAQISEILGDKLVSALKYQDLKSNKEKKLAVNGVFIEIGSEPSVDFCRHLVKLNDRGEIIIDRHNMSSVSGIFAGGDVSDVVEKQIIIAAGEGAKAAIGAAAYLSRQKEKL